MALLGCRGKGHGRPCHVPSCHQSLGSPDLEGRVPVALWLVAVVGGICSLVVECVRGGVVALVVGWCKLGTSMVGHLETYNQWDHVCVAGLVGVGVVDRRDK